MEDSSNPNASKQKFVHYLKVRTLFVYFKTVMKFILTTVRLLNSEYAKNLAREMK